MKKNDTTGPSILHLDIENSHTLLAGWGLYDQTFTPDSIVDDWFLISCAFLWDHEEIPTSITVKANDIKNDKSVVKRMHEMISACDFICTHNGDKFDLPKFNTRAIYYGLDPIEPKPTIDTLRVAKKHFKFTSNKLDYIGQYLGLGRKVETPRGLWMRILTGNTKERQEALKIMAEYNEGDVLLLKKVYHKLRPYMANHPNQNLFLPDEGCPVCASKKIQQRGSQITRTGRKKRYQCQDCGAWSSGKSVSRVEIR